jgi:N-acetylglucosaminyldiphosphoundecaprenol N-acetyl-beta-D-mannosaminyltransferase
LLFVSFGCPKQEKWIAMHYRSLGVPVSAGVGATIDFLAGTAKRAPVWMQRTGLEWTYRLAQEPRRLFKRYFKDLWVFGWKILGQLWQLQLRQPASTNSAKHRTASSAQRGTEPTFSENLPTRQSFTLSPGERAGLRGNATFSEAQPTEVRNDGNYQLIKIPARLDLAAVCQNSLSEAFTSTHHCLLDMSHVQFIDSTGVGLLIRLQKKIRADGRQLVLIAPTAMVRRALELMRLQDFFDTASDLPSALALIAARMREQADAVQLRTPAAVNPLLWQGEITAANAPDVWQRTETHIAARHGRDLVIDMSSVRFMDSTGLGMMVRARKLAQREQVKLEFTHLQPAVQNVIHLARLEQFLLPANHRELAVN